MINAGGYGLQPNYGKGDKLIKVHFNGLINLLKVLHISEIKKFIQIGSPQIRQSKFSIKKYIFAGQIPLILMLNIKYPFFNKSFKKKISSYCIKTFQVYGPKQDNNKFCPF